MGASQRVQILTDESEKLSLLKAYLDNPSLIKELSEEVIKLNSLTKEQEEKLSQATKFLSEFDQKSKEISDAQELIRNERNELEKNKGDFIKVSADSNELWQKKWSDSNDREAAISNAEKALKQSMMDIGTREKKLADDTALLQKNKDDWQAIVDVKTRELSDEADRLSELSKSLDKRAEKIRLREQASEL